MPTHSDSLAFVFYYSECCGKSLVDLAGENLELELWEGFYEPNDVFQAFVGPNRVRKKADARDTVVAPGGDLIHRDIARMGIVRDWPGPRGP